MRRMGNGGGVWAFLVGCLMVGVVYGGAYRNEYGKLPARATVGDRLFAEYFRAETERVSGVKPVLPPNAEEWERRRLGLRAELQEMLGLSPMPERTDLKATVTGVLDHSEFTVEKLHFQSRPGLYATANVYVPKGLKGRAPTVLYVCGHAQVKTNGVSFGNKVAYQHHGAWFARNGYVCLVLDTIQLGEIEGIHHGTYRERLWWWNSRGYTPAGAEAWNCIRALDYLQSRSDVDGARMGVTGRSGGGAYSWWVAALDDRIAAACPVAGITDLENHVHDGVVEGHCDCMFMVNTYRWDYAMVASMMAPRPLLICNTDKDTIFPLDGVIRVHGRVRDVYDALGAWDRLGLLITEGAHKDTQDLQVPVMRWFNRWLKGQDRAVENAAVAVFTGPQLKVFDRVPADEITSRCYETFTVLAGETIPFEPKATLDGLRRKTFGGWPEVGVVPVPVVHASGVSQGLRLESHDFEVHAGFPLRLYVLRAEGGMVKEVRLRIMDEPSWRRQLPLARAAFGKVLNEEWSARTWQAEEATTSAATAWVQQTLGMIRDRGEALVWFAPRGVGFTALSENERYVVQQRRRFMLLGQTLAGMQVWDVVQAAKALRGVSGFAECAVRWEALEAMGEVAAFASLFSGPVTSLHLSAALREDKLSPDFLNWRRMVTPSGLAKLVETKTVLRIGP